MLRTWVLLVGALFILPVLLGGCDSHATDKIAIQRVMDSYTKAFASKDGEKYASHLSENTFQYYERLMKLALQGTKGDLEALNAADQLEVLRIRARATRKQIEGKSGREYAIFSAKSGWYAFGDPTEAEGVELTNFRFAPPDTAYAQPRGGMRNKPLDFRYTFIKQGEEWKFDEPSSYEHWSTELQDESQESGMPLAAYLIELVSEETGKKVPTNIYERPLR